MSPCALALAALLTLAPLALAQEAPSGSPADAAPPGRVEPVPTSLTLAATPAPVPDGVSATLAAPRTVTGPVSLTLTLQSARTAPVAFGVGRDNDQNCAFAPTVRVLRVGTREVVYPDPAAGPRFCTQELQTRTAPARGSAVFTRSLDLPAGDYMIEGWFAGLAQGERVKVPAQPVRVTVR